MSIGPSVAASPAWRPAITSATSPSPKLDRTPDVWISASGQSWAITPAMKVVPALEVERPGRVVVGLVLVVDGDRAVRRRNASRHVECTVQQSRNHVLRAPRAVLDDGAQPGVEHQDLWPPTALDVQPPAQEPGFLGGFGRRTSPCGRPHWRRVWSTRHCRGRRSRRPTTQALRAGFPSPPERRGRHGSARPRPVVRVRRVHDRLLTQFVQRPRR